MNSPYLGNPIVYKNGIMAFYIHNPSNVYISFGDNNQKALFFCNVLAIKGVFDSLLPSIS